jgi:uncharacterized protein YdeI (YjbR/CyaY-like superfamily)
MELAFADIRAFDAWLRKNHQSSDGVWLKLAKKGSGTPSVSYAEAVEVALCWGWIDGQKRALDAHWWLQKLTPRTKTSIWSKINCDKAEALIAAKRMRAAGQAEIDAAKADGRWDAAYAGSRTIVVPDDLTRALRRNAKARRAFEQLDSQNRYAILYRIHDAKRPETRARRIEQFVTMLAEGRTIHQRG